MPYIYHIAQVLGGGKLWRNLCFTKFTIYILTMSRDINKEGKQTGIHQSFTQQSFW